MRIQELLAANRDQQFDWLTARFLKEAIEAEEDIESYISLMAWDEPLGSLLKDDLDILDDMIKSPSWYDLGWLLQERLPNMHDERAVQINNGSILTPTEFEMAKQLKKEGQINDAYLGEEGIFCSGSTIKLSGPTKAFVSFTGKGRGQGGIDYQFYRIFRDQRAAIEHFEALPDLWLPL